VTPAFSISSLWQGGNNASRGEQPRNGNRELHIGMDAERKWYNNRLLQRVYEEAKGAFLQVDDESESCWLLDGHKTIEDGIMVKYLPAAIARNYSHAPQYDVTIDHEQPSRTASLVYPRPHSKLQQATVAALRKIVW
jgi:hypothetical protein